MTSRSVTPVASAGSAATAQRPSQAGRRWTEETVEPPPDLRLLPLALSWWAGCLIGLLLVPPVPPMVAVLAGVVLVIGLLMTMPGARAGARVRATTGSPAGERNGSGARLRGVGVAVAGLATGALVSGSAVHGAISDPLAVAAGEGRFAQLTVQVDGSPEIVRSRFTADDSGAGTTGAAAVRYRIAVTAIDATVAGREWSSDLPVSLNGAGAEWAAATPGQVMEVSGVLAPDDFPAIPAVQLRTTAAPRVVAAAPWWSRAATRVRTDLAQRGRELGGDPGALLPGLVVGDTSAIDERLDADAKATGLTHLLAVSGSHFAIVCGAVVLILRRAGPRQAAVGGGVVLLGLVVLVGPEPSVLRASVMGGITVFALFVGRTRTAVPALCTAVVVLLISDPGLALSAGFALSVLATGGLVLLAPVWSKALQRRGFPRGWAEVLAIPMAASVVTVPVIAALSGTVSFVSVPANILAAVVVAPALVLGLVCALAGPWWPAAADALAQITAPLLGWIAGVAHTLAQLPNATTPWPSGLPWVLGLTGGVIAALGLLRRQRIRAVFGAVLSGAALVMVPVQVLPPVGWPPAGWLIAGCEVGQGDAFVIATDEPGSAVVIDAGPDPVAVADCLDRLGIGTVPLLVLTHLHADHVDGLPGVLAGRSVGMIGVGPGRDPATAWRTITTTAAARGIPVVQVHPDDRWASGGLTIDVLGPEKLFTGTDSDPNNDSVVVRAERAGVRMLMTGDIEPEAQRALLRAQVDLRTDVLKVPHHGSAKDLPEFLAAVRPAVAMIGVGQDNDYGHPSPSLLAALHAVGVGTVLRTDTDGDIAVVVMDGVLGEVERGPLLRGR